MPRRGWSDGGDSRAQAPPRATTSIEPPSKIVFSWTIEPPDEHAGIESEVTVTIRRDGGETELVIRHEKLTRAGAAARHDEGWRGALDQLARMMEAEGLPAQGKG